MTSPLTVFLLILLFYHIKKHSFHIAASPFSNRSRKTVICGGNISDTIESVSYDSLFLQHFDVIFDLLLNGRTATWNLFVKLMNPLHPSISMHILLTVLCIFPDVLKRRICFTVKSFSSW